MGKIIMVIEGAAAGPWTMSPDTMGKVVVMPYAKLTLAALKDCLPDTIVLPLFGTNFDALDVLARLAQFGFSGPVVVTGPALPNPGAIARELSAAAPGMAVSLVDATHQAGLSRL